MGKMNRLITSICAWILSRQSKAFMKRMGFKNIRRNLGKHNDLFVVAYICTDYPFTRQQNHFDAHQADSDRSHDPCPDKAQDIRIR